MTKKIESIISYLNEQVEIALDNCGEGDEVVYLPAKKALKTAESLKKDIELIHELSDIGGAT